jgi:hypothetical protein
VIFEQMPTVNGVPQCQKNTKVVDDLHGSAVYVHPLLRDDICPDQMPSGALSQYFELRQNSMKRQSSTHHGNNKRSVGHNSHLRTKTNE